MGRTTKHTPADYQGRGDVFVRLIRYGAGAGAGAGSAGAGSAGAGAGSAGAAAGASTGAGAGAVLLLQATSNVAVASAARIFRDFILVTPMQAKMKADSRLGPIE